MTAKESIAVGLISTILSIEGITSSAKNVLLILHCYTDSEDKCWLSDYEIAKLAGLSSKSIQTPLALLTKAKLIRKTYDESRQRYIKPLAYEWETPLDPVEPPP